MKQGISSPPPPPPPLPLPPPARSLPSCVYFRALQRQHFTNASLMASGTPRSFVKIYQTLSFKHGFALSYGRIEVREVQCLILHCWIWNS